MKMSVSTRASSEAWKLKPSRRIQRRLPLTTCPRPGISTKNSSATASDQQRPGHLLQVFGAHAEDDGGQHEADQAQHELALEIRERVARFLAGDRDRGRRDHDEAEQHDGGDQRERHRVDVQAAASRTLMRAPAPRRRTRCRAGRSRETCRGSNRPATAARCRLLARTARRRAPLLPWWRRAPCGRCRRARFR